MCESVYKFLEEMLLGALRLAFKHIPLIIEKLIFKAHNEEGL